MYKSKEENREFTQFTIVDYDTHQSLSMQLTGERKFNEESFDKMVIELKKFLLDTKLQSEVKK